jgi:hypothetical protein
MNMGRLVWLVTVEVDPIRTASEDCRHPKAPPSHRRYRPRPSCAANAAPEWQAKSYRSLRVQDGACPLKGCVSRFRTPLTGHSAVDRCSLQREITF